MWSCRAKDNKDDDSQPQGKLSADDDDDDGGRGGDCINIAAEKEE